MIAICRMKKSILRGSFILFVLAGFNIGCRKQALDKFYNPPSNLAQPIYQQLAARGNFKSLLALVDKAGYKSTLRDAGYWTFFAPTDSAFQVWFKNSGHPDIASIDSATARAIVQYLLVFNGATKSDLANYQSNTGTVPDLAFKRRTAYYTGFYKDTSYGGQAYLAVASNRNSTGGGIPYISTDNNNKYITYFTDIYFGTHNLSAYDYNYFYPSSPYSGFNVADARVLEKDITAQNGVIHIIDKVITPTQSIDEYLRNKPQYSEFRKLLEKYMVQFISNLSASTKYNLITGLNNQVVVKVYSTLLPYSPNNENFLKVEDNDGQKDGWSIFVPTNTALDNYINTVLLQHYASLDSLPAQVIADLLNSHMWPTTLWPSKFTTTYNALGEPAKLTPSTDIIDPKVLSNGIFYGTNKVQDANVFSTVYGKAYLDPRFSIMTMLLNMDLKGTITNSNLKFTVFMMSDSAIHAAGYSYNANTNAWSYSPPGAATSTGDNNRLNLLRILSTSVILTPNGELNNLTPQGITNSYAGECLVYGNNQVRSVGNVDAKTVVHITGSSTASNGIVYYTDSIFRFSQLNIGIHIQNLGTTAGSPFKYFWQYLNNSTIYAAATGAIAGVQPGSFYTVFAPDSAAIVQAVNDGYLPGTGTAPNKVPNFAPTDAAGQNLVANFILNHIVSATIIPDGLTTGGFQTLLKDANGNNIIVTVSNQPKTLQITDDHGRASNVIDAQSYNLSNRCVIQLTDNYFQY
jgi:uncharacterized surface protein with fasciclin (FAS1) repeats